MALKQFSLNLPITREEMLEIPGVTPVNIEKWGHRFLEVTTKYADEQMG